MIKKHEFGRETENIFRILDNLNYGGALRQAANESRVWKLESIEPHFPRSCIGCRSQILDITAFQSLPAILEHKTYDHYSVKVRECRCGSHIGLVVRTKRDLSEQGLSRRQLFDDCVMILSKVTKISEDHVSELLRDYLNGKA